ncbi:hypothetical protein PT974_10724 [Cladobotryum mycophilum]|uniref:Uncharacterized protein n=1 Tax=Cladobotryum mycophilum TaxID=491253 RepID=A0ABR0SBN1_9HYPO
MGLLNKDARTARLASMRNSLRKIFKASASKDVKNTTELEAVPTPDDANAWELEIKPVVDNQSVLGSEGASHDSGYDSLGTSLSTKGEDISKPRQMVPIGPLAITLQTNENGMKARRGYRVQVHSAAADSDVDTGSSSGRTNAPSDFTKRSRRSERSIPSSLSSANTYDEYRGRKHGIPSRMAPITSIKVQRHSSSLESELTHCGTRLQFLNVHSEVGSGTFGGILSVAFRDGKPRMYGLTAGHAFLDLCMPTTPSGSDSTDDALILDDEIDRLLEEVRLDMEASKISPGGYEASTRLPFIPLFDAPLSFGNILAYPKGHTDEASRYYD